jgi:hypothetical protein
MKILRKALMVFSALMAVGAAGLLAWANWPVPTTSQTNQLHLIAPTTWGEMDTRQVNAIQFEYTLTNPEAIKPGQTGHYEVVLTGLPASVNAMGESWQLHIRSELVIPGFINQQAGMISQTVPAGSPLYFGWDVKASGEIQATGMLRVFVDYTSRENQVETQLLSVNNLELTSSSLFGLSTRVVTSLAVSIFLLAGLAGSLGLTSPRV